MLGWESITQIAGTVAVIVGMLSGLSTAYLRLYVGGELLKLKAQILAEIHDAYVTRDFIGAHDMMLKDHEQRIKKIESDK